MTFNLNFSNLKLKVSNLEARVDTMEVALDNLNATLNTHLTTTTDAHSSSAITLASVSGLAAGDLQAAIEELLQKINDHINSTDAHDAVNISAEPLVNIDQTNVQAILEGLEQLELTNFNTVQTRIDNLCANNIAITSPVNRTFTNTQNAIDVLNFDIVQLQNDSGDHETLIQQILASLLNSDSGTTALQNTVTGLSTGTVPFTGIIFPTGAAGTPQVGSAYFNPGDSKLYIYNGSGYKTVQLV